MNAARLLGLAQRLSATAEGLTLDEIAEDLGVGRRTAERARDALRDVFTVEERKDGRKTRFRLTGGLSSQMRAPTTNELAEMELAITSLRKRGEVERAERLDNLRTKIGTAMRQADRIRLAPDLQVLDHAQIPICTAGPQPRMNDGVLETCQEALLADRVLGFHYVTGSGQKAWREVAPRGLLFGPRAYLVGALHDWGQPALWRLDRMTAPTLTDRAAWPDPDFDLAEFALKSFGAFQETPRQIILRFDVTVTDEAASFLFHPQQEAAVLPDGRLEVRFEAGGLLELSQHLFTWGGNVEIVAPAELREIYRNELERSLSRLGQ